MKKNSFTKHYWLMIAPAMVWILLFNIKPMFGIVMAFQDFNPGLGILGSEWVGLENFKYMFSLNDTKTIFFNTILLPL